MAVKKIDLPEGFDWVHWVERFDQMQSRYLVKRQERFDIILRMVKETQESPTRILDLGCGVGSLTLKMLEAIPNVVVYGVDFDPFMLVLAKKRLEVFGDRVNLFLADLRSDSWMKPLPQGFSAAISATALHWLAPDKLEQLYKEISELLVHGGLFINADHAGSNHQPIQHAWESHREVLRKEEGNTGFDDWEGFWGAYSDALHVDMNAIRNKMLQYWEESLEEGMPLAWHCDKLRDSGFEHVDCFWRSDCDAIYGGIRSKQ